MGVDTEGERDVLGLWFQQSEGAKFWLQVLSLYARGMTVRDIQAHLEELFRSRSPRPSSAP